MATDQLHNFKGIVSCISSFNTSICLTKTVEFTLSSIIFIIGAVILYKYIRLFGFKDKMYINISLFFMLFYLIMNMIYCFWNTVYEFYSIQTFCHNLYFLTIVVYTTKSYLIKKTSKPKLSLSRLSDLSADSNEETNQSCYQKLKRKKLLNSSFYKSLYKTIALIFFLLFTLIFVSSLIGDIKSQQNGQSLAQDQGAEKDETFFSFFKNSCQQLWYLCVNITSVLLSLIVLIVLYKNYIFQQSKIKQLTLVTSTVHQKKVPFHLRDSRQSNYYQININTKSKKLNNPLTKLAVWIFVNIFGQIINLVQSGLLLKADSQKQCRIIEDNAKYNQILMLFFVIGSVYIQYGVSLWFFYDILKQRTRIISKNQTLLIEPYQFSQEIRVGQIELNPSLKLSSSSNQK